MKKKIKALILIVVAALCAGALFLYIQARTHVHNKRIKVSGNIEATDIRISFRVAGKIKELLTDEGRLLKRGDLVARLEIDELTQIRDEAAASLKAAQFQYELDKLDYVRAESLFQAGSISAQQRDAAKTKADADKANVEALQASLDLAQTRLGFADLAAPNDGFVLVKSAEAGEVVQAGSTVFTAADLNDIWLTAYINERDLGKVKLNQPAQIKTDTYPNKIYKGWVSFISQEAEFTPKQIQTTEERVKLVYRIKIQVDNSSLDLKPGMPADGYIIE
ncbi:MAG: efflux RND transporter periplasmic adaptor subunit [Candidatus Omnitrophica bacterium]|nr:efflux RND transporter periplasmic adaptor subunit [Candidatus Omnitrophota bacterium]MDD5237049.1 efflux RND transporter periplasmic adaptor subunit [Candidatus Omnitrophota bacterium]MDD5610666.1 efflux RND transporter periplasmic adaptor subunit [Candidatus Omnitrophota bacterium]